ncbi:MAG TPA: helix-turn-helix domain-containing protein [Candidatus Limnocylindrales bacterium]|nr:helix-turn-helix domain-containing protein [Candidatus Limnocylindrales bacterium]
MAKYRTADEVFEEYVRDPENARRFAESEIGLAVTRLFTRLRKDAGLRQEDLADRIGRSQAYVAKLEGGAYDRCALPTLRTFARALGYDIDVGAMMKPLDAPVAHTGTVGVDPALDAELRGSDGPLSGIQAALVQSLTAGSSGATAPEICEPKMAAA